MYRLNKELLRDYITQSPFTVEDVCALAGVSRSTFYWQLKNNKFSLELLLEIANLLLLDDEQLLEVLKGSEDNE